MIERFISAKPLHRVGHDKRLDELFREIGDVPPEALVELDLALRRLAHEFRWVVRTERRVAAEHDVGDDPGARQRVSGV